MSACEKHSWKACAVQHAIAMPEGERHECQYCRKCFQKRCIVIDTDEGNIIYSFNPDILTPKQSDVIVGGSDGHIRTMRGDPEC